MKRKKKEADGRRWQCWLCFSSGPDGPQRPRVPSVPRQETVAKQVLVQETYQEIQRFLTFINPLDFLFLKNMVLNFRG